MAETAEPKTGPGAASAEASEQLDARYPRWAVIGIFLILAVASVGAAEAFLMPVILAFLLTLVFTPLRRALNRMGLPSWLCATLIISALIATSFVGIATLSTPVAEWAAEAPSIGRQIERKLRGLRGSVETIAEAGEQIDKLAEGGAETAVADDTQKVEVKEKSVLQRVAASAPTIGAQAVFVFVLLFFVIASGDMFYEKVVHVLPTLTDKRRALKIAFDIERRLARYFSTIALINAGLGVAIGLTMWAIGMPSPALFGLVGFILNFIPFIGAIIGVVLAVAIGFITFPDPWSALLAGGLYLSLTTIEGQFVTPYFVGRSLKLNTVVVFLSVALWAWLWSVVGMIIAVPVLVVIRVFSEHLPALEPLGDFLSARGAENDDDETEVRPRPKLSDG